MALRIVSRFDWFSKAHSIEMGGLMGGGPSPPGRMPPVDWSSAIQMARHTGLQEAQYNRPTEITPFAARSTARKGGRFVTRTKLRGPLKDLFSRIGPSLEAPPPTLPAYKSPDEYVSALMARQAPSLEENRMRLENQLYNAGAVPGSEAWTRAMRDQIQSETDARMRAILSGEDYATSQQNRALQQYGQQIQARELPLREFLSLYGGTSPLSGFTPSTPVQFNPQSYASVEQQNRSLNQQADLARYQGELQQQQQQSQDLQSIASLAGLAAMAFAL